MSSYMTYTLGRFLPDTRSRINDFLDALCNGCIVFMCSHSVHFNHTHSLTTFALHLGPKIKQPPLRLQHISTDVDLSLYDYFTPSGILKVTIADSDSAAQSLMILIQEGSQTLFDAINNAHRSETAVVLGTHESNLLPHTPHTLITILEPQNTLASPTNTKLKQVVDARHHELYEFRNTKIYCTLMLFQSEGDQCSGSELRRLDLRFVSSHMDHTLSIVGVVIFDTGHRLLPKLLALRETPDTHKMFRDRGQDQKASQDCEQLSSNKPSDPVLQRDLITAGLTLVAETPTPKERNDNPTDPNQPDLEDEAFEIPPEIWDFLLDEQQRYPDYWLSLNS
ncbi:uncharacterized protein MELLADRAFT_67326 [Melampsora larici-populina 98AG31]|uniref:Uncharacterized protein n=1 Tax=Melampsora larici-populina (strain 98AG31 / pathotype 3-4-7) TaxID=747676 RepID=F4S2P1_MELLP|nr:uncharacterized protein MELLADRAFT_67326 [Melampsora larici-populina 98AG31]EGG01034.1 hypothetical protein MELLADRAFT_67326 [Melampsora larici-populina 98AG31]